ncbi:MAG: hypothetical protein FJ137_02380 [Deltaproteobacteria bacterium]|nr:hypothetical protein [Deltaproteobacteria bacterium]
MGIDASVVFQCRACRALVVADELARATDGVRAGLACSACGVTTWLPLVGSSRSAARGYPSSSTLAPPDGVDAGSSSGDGGLLAPLSSIDRRDEASGALPSPAALPPATEPTAATREPLAAPTETTAPTTAPAATSAPTVATASTVTTGSTETVTRASTAAPPGAPTAAALGVAPPAGPWSEQLRARVLARWGSLGEVSAAQSGLAARLDRLARGPWNEEAEHKALLETASMTGELAFVGARYRAVLDVVRDDPRARAGQQELLKLALATMKNAPDLASTNPERRGGVYAALVIFAALLLVGGASYFVMLLARTLEDVGNL